MIRSCRIQTSSTDIVARCLFFSFASGLLGGFYALEKPAPERAAPRCRFEQVSDGSVPVDTRTN